MGKSRGRGKRKNSSDGSNAITKSARNGDSPVNDDNATVSESIRVANSVLFDDSISNMDNSVFEQSPNQTVDPDLDHRTDRNTSGGAGSSGSSEPSITDVVNILNRMDKKLEKLDTLETKVSKFESEINKIWTFVNDSCKSNKEAVSEVAERVDALEFSLGVARSDITRLESEKVNMQDSLLYVQSQSMRNNLMFANIPEDEHEKPDKTETKLRQFMVQKLQLAQDYVDSLQFERVHRTGDNSYRNQRARNSVGRNIVAKFTYFKDRETVKRARSALKGSEFYIYEQFPKEIADRRRALVPKMKQAIRDGKRSWISYDTLYIDGRPVRSDGQ